MTQELINAVRQAVREELAAAPISPEFANFAYLHARYGITRPTLNRLADSGVIRRKKIGSAIQAQTLYHVSDISAWMYQTEEGE